MKVSELIENLEYLHERYGNLDVGYYSQYGTFFTVINSVEYTNNRNAMNSKPLEGIFMSFVGESE